MFVYILRIPKHNGQTVHWQVLNKTYLVKHKVEYREI